MKYNCLIADDNLFDREIAAYCAGKSELLNVAKICCDGKEAVTAITNGDISIVFSDIDMPDLSGISLLKSLENPPVFIFITSYPEYAVESFELNVIDYIVKPLTFDRFLKAVNKAVEYIEVRKQLSGPGSEQRKPHSQFTSNDKDEYFFIRETDGVTKLYYHNILYIESMGDFSKLYTLNGERHVTLVSLKNLEKQLPADIFKRIHRQYIVNIHHIITIAVDSILLDNKQVLPVSILYKQGLTDQVINKKITSRFTG